MTPSLRKAGLWSAILSALFSILWFITFQMKGVFGTVPPWQNTDAYARTFTASRILYICPSLLLAISFIVLMAVIHRYVPEEKKLWSLIGLSFAIVYSVMASINYNIQGAAVLQSLTAGETRGIAMFLPDNPHSVFNALANSYVYMALAMFFTAFAFEGSRLKQWIRYLFLVQIITAVGQAGWSLFGLSTGIFIGTSMIWVIGAPVSFILLAILFKQSKPSS